MAEFKVLAESKDNRLSAALVVDGAGNVIRAHTINRRGPNETNVALARHTGEGGAVVYFEYKPARGHKADDIAIAQAGDKLIVYCVAHDKDGGEDYASTEQIMELPGFCEPYPQGRPQVGARSAVAFEGIDEQGSGSSGGASVALTQAEIEKIADAVAARFGDGGDVRAAILGKVRQALKEADVLTVGAFNGPAGRFEVYEQLVNTSYTGAKEALKEARKEEARKEEEEGRGGGQLT